MGPSYFLVRNYIHTYLLITRSKGVQVWLLSLCLQEGLWLQGLWLEGSQSQEVRV